MQYQVPHFLETEQRIWGPFTFTNFVIIVGIGLVLGVLYFLGINFVLWVSLVVICAAITLSLMFGSYNGRNLSIVVIDIFNHLFRSRRYTWAREESKEVSSEFVLTKKELRSLPNIGAVRQKEEKTVSQRVDEISKLMDQE